MSPASRKWTGFAMLSELPYKICWEPDFFSSYYLSFSSSFILHLKMFYTEDKIVYLKLQGVINYCSWRQNMISLFKREQAYEIVLGLKSKSAELAFLMKLMKLQFKNRLIADTVSFAGSTMMILLSRESTVIGVLDTGASASPPSVILVLSWDDIKDGYQFYSRE